MAVNGIKIEFKEPEHSKGKRSVLYVNEKRINFTSLAEESEIKSRIYKILSEFTVKQQALNTMRLSK